jgi:hypothetical protein
MGFLDKAKEAADKAVASAQELAQQGQAKYEEYAVGKAEGDLFRVLGEAYYNEQRRGAGRSPVEAALGALDQHFRAAAGNG